MRARGQDFSLLHWCLGRWQNFSLNTSPHSMMPNHFVFDGKRIRLVKSRQIVVKTNTERKILRE